MSNVIKIPAYIQLAKAADLFVDERGSDLRAHQVYFTYSLHSLKFVGCYVLPLLKSRWYIKSICDQYVFEMIYVLSEDKSGFQFALELCLGSAADLKDVYGCLRYNFVYYAKESDDVVLGPFVLNPSTDPYELKRLLDNDKLYIISKNQSFKELTQA